MAYGIKCNVKAPHRFLRMGALCWMRNTNQGWYNERFPVLGTSRGGRIVDTWVDARDLTNFRPGFVFKENERVDWLTRDEAQAMCDDLNARFGSQPVRPHAADFGVSP